MDFLLEITKIWRESRDFLFADFFLEIYIFLNPKDGMDFPGEFFFLNLFHQVITN